MQGGNDVARVAARREDDEQIAALREARNLAGKNLIVPEIISDAGKQRAVRRKRDGRKGAAGLRVTAHELGGEVRGFRGTPVAEVLPVALDRAQLGAEA